MGYYHLKNLDINKKEGTIIGEFADSNVSPITYFKSEIEGKSFHEKYSSLMYDIITGNYHPSNSSKYSVLCNTWCEPALKNFINDSHILGIERAYDKYKNVIEDILDKREPKILKSEIDLHYEIGYGDNKDYNTLNSKVNSLYNFMQKTRNNPNLSYIDKLELYQNFVKTNDIHFPLVTLRGYEHFTKIYLCPNVAKSGFLSYKITVENTETGVLKNFESEHMGIGWITSYGESEMAFKMQSFENKFIIFQKINKILNESITQKNSKNMILKLDTLNIKSDNIRTLLDLLEEDSRVPDFEYDNKNKEIIIKFELEKSNETPDILDEMYG